MVFYPVSVLRYWCIQLMHSYNAKTIAFTEPDSIQCYIPCLISVLGARSAAPVGLNISDISQLLLWGELKQKQVDQVSKKTLR